MKWVILKVVVLTLLATCVLQADSNLGYIEFNTNSMDQLEVEINSLNRKGIRVVHIFPPDAVIFSISDAMPLKLTATQNIRYFSPPPEKTVHQKI